MLQLLPIFLCPLMMLVCMGGMLRPGKKRDKAGQETGASRWADGALTGSEQELARLRAAQADLGRQIEDLAARIEEERGEGAARRRAAG